MSVKCEIKDYNILKKKLDKMQEAPRKAMAAAESDIRQRAPGWIATGIVDRFNLEGKKTEGKKAVLSGRVGKLKIKGSLQNDTLELDYSGRYLTPVHFGMTPIDKPSYGKPYTLKWKVLRAGKGTTARIKKLTNKQRKNIGRNFTRQGTRNSPRSPWMLQPTGAKSEGKITYIPFQRREQPGKFDRVSKTTTLPQMVTRGEDGPLHPEVAAKFYDNLEKRVNHNINRFMKI